MSRKMSQTLRSFAVGVVLALGSGACVYGPVGPGPYPGYYYDYYYYPHADVYFQVYTGEYYYRTGSGWRHSRVLPNTIYLHPQDRVHLQIRDKTPYARDQERRQQYRPAPGARFERNRNQDRNARQYNQREHDEYRKKYGR